MKILVVAPVDRPQATALLVIKAMNSISLDVEVFPYREVEKVYTRFQMNINLHRKMAEYSKNDLVIIIKGESIEPKIFEGLDCRLALWDFDFDSFTLPDRLVNIGAYLDAIFLMCEPWIDPLRLKGIPAFFLPQATDPAIYHPVRSEPTQECDVAFIGTRKPGREALLDTIGEHFKLRVYGEQWQGTPYKPGKPAYMEDFNIVCNSAKIIVNVTPSTDWPIYKMTFSQRVYMVLAARGFMLTDEIPGLDQFFQLGKEIVCYSDTEDLLKKIDYYLKHDDERLSIARAGRRRILREHTYHHRIKEMFTCLGLLPSVQRNIRA